MMKFFQLSFNEALITAIITRILRFAIGFIVVAYIVTSMIAGASKSLSSGGGRSRGAGGAGAPSAVTQPANANDDDDDK